VRGGHVYVNTASDFPAMTDAILPMPAIPDGLREASQRSVLIPFIGAGVSRLAGCPTWAGLADGALKECIAANKFTYGQLEQIKHLPPRVKLSIARGLEEQHGFAIALSNVMSRHQVLTGDSQAASDGT